MPFGRGVVDRHRLAARRAQADGEGRGDRARVPLGHRHVVDRQRRRRVVVGDRADGPGRRRSSRCTGLEQVDDERLVGLVEQVAVDRDGDRLASSRRREASSVAGRGRVVGRERSPCRRPSRS